MPGNKNYNIVPYSDIHFILDEMSSSIPAAQDVYDLIKDYIKKNARAETRYGILLNKPYKLYLYTRDRRTDQVATTECIDITIPKKNLFFSSSTPLEGLILIKYSATEEVTLFDFHKSIVLKKLCFPPPANPPSENYIYFNFFSAKTSPTMYKEKIDEVKKQFHQSSSYRFHHFQIQDEKNYLIQLKADIQSQSAGDELLGSTTVIFDSHCNEGSYSLKGQIETATAIINTQWSIPTLLTILQKFKFSSTIIFDLYMCWGGQSTAGNASFAERFNDALIQHNYRLFSINASLKTVALCTYEPWILCQSPSLTAQFGFLTLPLNSVDSLKNTEPYLKIFGFPDYSKLIFPSLEQQSICALQKWANDLMTTSKITLEYTLAYKCLNKMWKEFQAFNMTLKKPLKNTIASTDPFYKIFQKICEKRELSLREIHALHILKNPPDFNLALQTLNKKNKQLQHSINCLVELTKLNNQFLRENIFNRHKNFLILHILNLAKKGRLTPEKALDKINKIIQQTKIATQVKITSKERQTTLKL